MSLTAVCVRLRPAMVVCCITRAKAVPAPNLGWTPDMCVSLPGQWQAVGVLNFVARRAAAEAAEPLLGLAYAEWTAPKIAGDLLTIRVRAEVKLLVSLAVVRPVSHRHVQ